MFLKISQYSQKNTCVEVFVHQINSFDTHVVSCKLRNLLIVDLVLNQKGHTRSTLNNKGPNIDPSGAAIRMYLESLKHELNFSSIFSTA